MEPDADFDRDELLAIFSAETEENLREMEEAFVQLESTPDDAETLQAIFRAAHTIKGNAAGLGFPALAKFAHAARRRARPHPLGHPGAHHARSPRCCSKRWTGCARSGRRGRHRRPTTSCGRDHLESDRAISWRSGRAAPTTARTATAEPQAGQRRAPRPASAAAGPICEGAFSRSQTLRVDIDKLDRMLNLTGEIAVARERLGDLLDRLRRAAADRSDRRSASRRRSAVPGSAGRGDEDSHGAARPHVPPVLPHGARRRHGQRASRRSSSCPAKTWTWTRTSSSTCAIRSRTWCATRWITASRRRTMRRALRQGRRAAACAAGRHEGGSIVIKVQDDGAGLERDADHRAGARQRRHARDFGKHARWRAVPADSRAGLFHRRRSDRVLGPRRRHGRGAPQRGAAARRDLDGRAGPAAGTTITLRLPLTLAIIRGFSVGVGDDTYVMPLDAVVECIEFPRDGGTMRRAAASSACAGRPLPYLRLRDCFRMRRRAARARERAGAALLRPARGPRGGPPASVKARR